jgi:hypothetical protein
MFVKIAGVSIMAEGKWRLSENLEITVGKGLQVN